MGYEACTALDSRSRLMYEQYLGIDVAGMMDKDKTLAFELFLPPNGRHPPCVQFAAQRTCSPPQFRLSVRCLSLPCGNPRIVMSMSCCILSGTAAPPMLRAMVPRSFIDLNREPYELDPRMFSGNLPGYANTGSPRCCRRPWHHSAHLS